MHIVLKTFLSNLKDLIFSHMGKFLIYESNVQGEKNVKLNGNVV